MCSVVNGIVETCNRPFRRIFEVDKEEVDSGNFMLADLIEPEDAQDFAEVNLL